MRPGGYLIIVDPNEPRPEEYDTVACCHCSAAVLVKPGSHGTLFLEPDLTRTGHYHEVPGASCFRCMKPVCLRCHAHGGCRPLERWLEQVEKRR